MFPLVVPIKHVVAFELPPWLIEPSIVSTLFGDNVIVLVLVVVDILPPIFDGVIELNSFIGLFESVVPKNSFEKKSN